MRGINEELTRETIASGSFSTGFHSTAKRSCSISYDSFTVT